MKLKSKETIGLYIHIDCFNLTDKFLYYRSHAIENMSNVPQENSGISGK